MQIPSINLVYTPQRVVKTKTYPNNTLSYNATTQVDGKDYFIKHSSEPSFEGIRSAANFRNLTNIRTIHCIYCGRPLLNKKVANKFKSNGAFTGPIRRFAQDMFPYIEYLHPTEKEALKKITIMAFDYPDITLSEAIKKLYPKANQLLLEEQKPILKELAKLQKKLPPNLKTKFKELLQITKYRLEDKKYIPKEFSGKEFVYKLNRLYDTINDEKIAERMLNIAEPLDSTIFKLPKEPLTTKFIDKIAKLTETRNLNKKKTTKSNLQLIIVKQLKKYAEILNRQDIINLCEDAIATIEHRPIKVKFSKKAFIYDLSDIFEHANNTELKETAIALAKRLPTSKTSVNAFITKHKQSASEAIGYDILRPSLVTIEHLHPKSQNGANALDNYALACERDNNARSNNNLKVFITNFAQANQEKYFKEIFEEVENGLINYDTAKNMIETFFAESGRKLNFKIPEAPTILEPQQYYNKKY